VPLPDVDLAAQMYEEAVALAHAAGYEHYEISNWAKPGFASQHNKTYWLNEPYLGFGAGAHSSWQGERYENIRSPREYIKRMETGAAVISAREPITRAAEISETMFLGLRLGEGIAWARFQERFGEDARVLFREPIARLTDWQMLQVDDTRMRLTEQGMLISNQLLWRFLLDESK
jgi:oxygen-independent coproporphyrinogen-3 oxidase